MEITPQSKVCRRPEQMWCDLGNEDSEVVVLDTTNNQYYGLESVAGRIWTLLEQPRRIDELAGVISSEYQVESEPCLSDLLKFIGDLHSRGLVEVSP